MSGHDSINAATAGRSRRTEAASSPDAQASGVVTTAVAPRTAGRVRLGAYLIMLAVVAGIVAEINRITKRVTMKKSNSKRTGSTEPSKTQK